MPGSGHGKTPFMVMPSAFPPAPRCLGMSCCRRRLARSRPIIVASSPGGLFCPAKSCRSSSWRVFMPAYWAVPLPLPPRPGALAKPSAAPPGFCLSRSRPPPPRGRARSTGSLPLLVPMPETERDNFSRSRPRPSAYSCCAAVPGLGHRSMSFRLAPRSSVAGVRRSPLSLSATSQCIVLEVIQLVPETITKTPGPSGCRATKSSFAIWPSPHNTAREFQRACQDLCGLLASYL